MTKDQKAMTETEKYREQIEEVRNFLCGYQVCVDLLQLRGYERKRANRFENSFDCEELLMGNEAYWRAKMVEIKALVDSMRNGREKLLLYYHYIRGESVEHSADLLGFSRRTGYRVLQRGLLQISFLYARSKRNGISFSNF